MRQVLIAGLLVLVACGQQLPTPECDPNPAFFGSRLTCGAAVTAAVRALPAGHPAIERIQFLFGSPTPWGGGRFVEDEERSVLGYVVFTYADSSERQYVQVAWWHDALSAYEPLPY